MAENENGQDKTEEATPKRLQKVRDEGQVPRPRELTTAFVLIGGVCALISVGGALGSALLGVMSFNFSVSRAAAFDEQLMLEYLANSAFFAIESIIPFMVILLLAALVGPVMLGGWLLSAKAMEPKSSRMNPIKGIQRMFSMNALIELLKAVAKFTLVAGITILILVEFQQSLLSLGNAAIKPAIASALSLVVWSVLGISCSMIVIALIDVPYQIYDHAKKMKMTLQEVKDEMKDTEGKPEVKGRMRQLQREMAQRRMMEAVPEADVVITNPEHFSVALKYDLSGAGSGAPVVIARGGDHLAIKIREIAKAHEVMILQAPPLARAIYFSTEIDREIPASLYLAVAQVLAYVFQLRAHERGEGQKPQSLDDIKVPIDAQYDSRGRPMNRV